MDAAAWSIRRLHAVEDPHVEGLVGQTLVDCALARGWTDVAATLRAHGGWTSDELAAAS